MEAVEAIMTRRSIRAYEPGEVTEKQVETMLRAAMAAPSAKNCQPWHFIVVSDHEQLDTIARIHPYAKYATKASLVIIVCIDTELEYGPGYGIQDGSAATMNILLSAHAQGLGCVWCGLYPREERIGPFRELFGIPETVIPLSLIVIGHAAELKGPSERFKPERIHNGSW